jgi:hypothetical protein
MQRRMSRACPACRGPVSWSHDLPSCRRCRRSLMVWFVVDDLGRVWAVGTLNLPDDAHPTAHPTRTSVKDRVTARRQRSAAPPVGKAVRQGTPRTSSVSGPIPRRKTPVNTDPPRLTANGMLPA